MNVIQYLKQQIGWVTIGAIVLQQSLVFASPIELSLEDSVNLALKNNPAIQIALADKEKSVWSKNEAEAGKLPTVSWGSSYNMNGRSGNFSSDGTLNNNLRMNWQLYSGNRIENQIKQAELGISSADLNVRKTKQQIKLDAETAYYNVLQAKMMLAVNQETVNNLKEHQTVVQAKYDAGVVAKSDVLRADVELSNAQQALIKSQNQYDLAVANLLNVMNLSAGTDIILKDELQYVQADLSLDECITLAMDNRPDIEQAKINVDIAAINVKSAQSGKLPSVSMSASTGWNDSFVPNDNNFSIGLSANWNIFDAGITNAKIKQGQASLERAKLQKEQLLDSVEQEIRQNYLSMKEAEKRLETTNVAVNKAEEDLYIAREKYNAGVGTNIDVIDAQLALTQAKTNHLQALYDYNVNKAKLEKAIGV